MAIVTRGLRFLTNIALPLPPPRQGRGIQNPLPWLERQGRGGFVGLGANRPLGAHFLRKCNQFFINL